MLLARVFPTIEKYGKGMLVSMLEFMILCRIKLIRHGPKKQEKIFGTPERKSRRPKRETVQIPIFPLSSLGRDDRGVIEKLVGNNKGK